MPTMKGTIVPKKGTAVHRPGRAGHSGPTYAKAIARALQHQPGPSHQTAKTVMGWTGASERTIKYWLAGTRGPSGENLIALATKSDQVMDTLLHLIGRTELIQARKILAARDALRDLLVLIEMMIDGQAIDGGEASRSSDTPE